MKYILGIDTTFHTCGVGLVNENGKVFANEKIDVDFTDEDAKKFFNFHNRSALSLIKPLLDKYSNDIFLVSASSEEGTFHSMPVGAIIANAISYLMGKKIVGVSHEVSHLHSNWLNRDSKDFLFPIVSLNISGAHSNIYLLKSVQEIKKIGEIIWSDNAEQFTGLGAFFDRLCFLMDINIKKGDGGLYLENIAKKGEPKYKKDLGDVKIAKVGENFQCSDIVRYASEKLKELNYWSFGDEERKKFQQDFSASFLDVLFGALTGVLKKTAEECGAKEIHLVGGAAANKILEHKLAEFCKEKNLNFKTPLRLEFCGDNAAMTALLGYYKWKHGGSDVESDFLAIKPSDWYYKYYCKNFLKKNE